MPAITPGHGASESGLATEGRPDLGRPNSAPAGENLGEKVWRSDRNRPLELPRIGEIK